MYTPFRVPEPYRHHIIRESRWIPDRRHFFRWIIRRYRERLGGGSH